MEKIELTKEQYLRLKELVKGKYNRGAHLAYGYVRGTPYQAMERCCNDNPFMMPREMAVALNEAITGKEESPWSPAVNALIVKVEGFVRWVPKAPRVKVNRPMNMGPKKEAAPNAAE